MPPKPEVVMVQIWLTLEAPENIIMTTCIIASSENVGVRVYVGNSMLMAYVKEFCLFCS